MTAEANVSPQDALNILVVDDDNDARKMTAEYLKELGFKNIVSCENGSEALRILQKDPTINFIISDWDMPLVDGHSLLQQVRAKNKLQHLPFVIVTSPRSIETDKVMMAAESMVDAYIVKPFRLATLKEKMDHVLALSVHGPQKTVVLADDDPDARAMVLEYLKGFGFKKIKAFDNGKEALVFLQDNPTSVSLIISDWEMPGMTGVELLVACRGKSALKDIPFLIITSQSSMESMKVKKAGKFQVDEYLLKPFNGALLKERIDSALSQRRTAAVLNEYANEGFGALNRGQFKQARSSFEKALKLNPKFAQGFAGMGDVHLRMQGAAAAIPYYQKAVAIDPFCEEHYLRLCHAYEAVDEVGRAINLMQMALQYLTSTIETHLTLAKLYIKRNALYKAQEELKRVLELDSKRADAAQLLSKVKTELDAQKKGAGAPPADDGTNS